MSISLRAARRLAVVGMIAAATFTPTAGRADVPPEKSLPASSLALIKVADASKLREALKGSQVGQLLQDPALKPLKDDISKKMADQNRSTKEKLGVSLDELLTLPEGAAWVALIGRDDPKTPLAMLISADAGKNAEKMAGVMTNATKLAKEDGAAVSTETFQSLTLTTIQGKKGEGEEQDPAPFIWTNKGSIFTISSDTAAIKDLLSHADGMDKSLADSESFQKSMAKVGTDGQVLAYVNVAELFSLVGKAAGAQGGNAAQIEGQLQLVGLNSLKGVGLSINFNTPDYDSVSKLFVYSPAPAQGLLKVFKLPAATLRPEPWVPATVASYQTISWDLDAAYDAINDLANMFAPGILQNVETQIVGPKGERISFQKDIFGPLGDRVTMISDFKKPITEDNQRSIFAIALEDSKAFQATLNKLIAITQAKPATTDFSGTTIYDFELPEMPNAPGGAQLKGTVSVAIAKDTLFISRDKTLLEQVLRPGGPSLAEAPGFQAVVGQYPKSTSTLSYQKPEEQARVLYDLIKSGQLKQAMEAAAANSGQKAEVPDLIDTDKLPEFEVFAKYLSPGGGYGIVDQDGATFTQFSMKKSKP